MSTQPTPAPRAAPRASNPPLSTSPAHSPGDPSLIGPDSLPNDTPQPNTNAGAASPADAAAPPLVLKALCYETLTTNSIFGLPTAQKVHLVRRFRERYSAHATFQFQTTPRSRTRREERNARHLMSYDVATQYFQDLYNAQALATAQATVAAAAAAAAANRTSQQADEAQQGAEQVAQGAGDQGNSDNVAPPTSPIIPPRVFSLPDDLNGPPNAAAAAGWDDDDDDDNIRLEGLAASSSSVDSAGGNPSSTGASPSTGATPSPSAAASPSSYLLRVWSRLGFNSFFPRPYTETLETTDDLDEETAADDTVEAAVAAATAAGGGPFHIIKMLSMYGAKHVYCRCTDGRHRELERREAFAFHGFDGAVVIKRARTSILPME
ncbi:hypothetical protein R3P38DRAFT_3185522 [Favolaschia claudopus]|uniref:Uncharacterized protein n=1 Tax=Favolaschia claudopus TaxID=2862362 RepID=A0AAW0C5B9_9AGAR